MHNTEILAYRNTDSVPAHAQSFIIGELAFNMKKKLIRRKLRDYLLRKGFTFKNFEPRPMIKFVREYFGNNRIRIKGLEIGVWLGDHSQEIKTYLNCDLYLLDPYEEYDEGNEIGFAEGDLSTAKEIAYKRIDGTWINRNFNGLLDFVYIDGNHSYESALEDIKFAKKLVRHGIIGGHDYSTDFPGVIKAVNEEFKNFNFVSNDWWAIV